ncbi:hypothetical protein AA313_de0205158 [Arthrobotrys entomopaga]|nr:hypothetical protein AA313_de0205158 [Arthrobotrys entomopaga]
MKSVISALLLAAVSAAPNPSSKKTTAIGSNPILFDGRIPPLFRSALLDDDSTSPYNAQYVLGLEPWSKVVHFPNVDHSLFDVPLGGKPVIVSINDKSIFQGQTGFRRSELLPDVNSGDDVTTNGIVAHHFSIRTDNTRPLNYSHEYQPVFIETQDYASHVWQLKTGTPFGESWTDEAAKTLRIYSSSTSSDALEIFNIPFTTEDWHNFALEEDWDNNMLTLYYSTGQNPLAVVAGPMVNDNSGKGQFHVGMLKLPTGPDGIDVTKDGYQEKRPNEGLTYGGVFIEDTSSGSVTLQPVV